MDFIFTVAILVSASIGSMIAAYRRRHRPVELQNTPVLLAYYSEGANLLPVKKGLVGGMPYSAIIIMGDRQGDVNNGDALLYMVELPFTAKIHLLGIPKGSHTTQLNPATADSLIERVTLEGNYDKHFSLFCEKGMQSDARYVLDPAAMQFTIDFCESHNWEIIGNELYFVQAFEASSPDDPTFMYNDIQKFVDEIRPALAAKAKPSRSSVSTSRIKNLSIEYRCPVCQNYLTGKDGYFSCPDQHGILVIGYKLPQIKSGSLANPGSATQPKLQHTDINCPVCASPMEPVPYGGSATIIDSCTRCPYRWLDAGELAPQR